jgi:hypothetical protein
MKPTNHVNEKNRRTQGENDSPRRVTFPKTDYSYQATSIAAIGARRFGSRQPSFRSISQDYFKYEAPNSFVGEIALFTVIVMIAGAAVMTSVGAIFHMARAFGIL